MRTGSVYRLEVKLISSTTCRSFSLIVRYHDLSSRGAGLARAIRRLVSDRIEPPRARAGTLGPQREGEVIGSEHSTLDIVRGVAVAPPVVRFVGGDRDEGHRGVAMKVLTFIIWGGAADMTVRRFPKKDPACGSGFSLTF